MRVRFSRKKLRLLIFKLRKFPCEVKKIGAITVIHPESKIRLRENALYCQTAGVDMLFDIIGDIFDPVTFMLSR